MEMLISILYSLNTMIWVFGFKTNDVIESEYTHTSKIQAVYTLSLA